MTYSLHQNKLWLSIIVGGWLVSRALMPRASPPWVAKLDPMKVPDNSIPFPTILAAATIDRTGVRVFAPRPHLGHGTDHLPAN